jgi:carbon storage regulator
MLIMCRHVGETILIGDDIEIVIAHIGRTRVKVGIRAPREVPVVAKEVKLVREANVAAASPAPAGAVSRLVSDLNLSGKNSRFPGPAR